MSGLIGDRKGTNTLEEMMEVSRERNREVAEEERLEALRKKEEAKRAKAPSMPATEASPVIIEPSMEDIVDFYGTPLCKNDYDALLEIYNETGQDMRLAYQRHRIAIRDERVIKIDLYGCRLVDNLPDCIGKLQALKGLYLHRAHLTRLPECIGDLQELERMDAWDNEIISLHKSMENMRVGAISIWGNPLNDDSKQMLERMKARGVYVRY